MTLRRLVIVGPPGSGKSTLAATIAAQLQLELFERDAHGPLGSDLYRKSVDDLLGRTSWVFDGFPYYVDESVYVAADCVIALRLSRLRTLRQVLQRSWRLRHADVGGHPQGSLRTWFRRDHAVRVAFSKYSARIREIDSLEDRVELRSTRVVILRNADQVQAFVHSLS